MFKILCLFLLAGSPLVLSQVVNNVRLVDHSTYFVNVMQEVMNEVERREWCNLKLDDITQNVDITIYGWHLNGTVTYKNGFLVGLQRMDLTQSTVQQVWTYSTADQTSTVQVRGTLNLREVALGWDVEFAKANGEVDNFTGIFTHELVMFIFYINKNVDRDEITVSVAMNSLSAGTRRMVFMPENSVSQVLQRQYIAGLAWDGVSSWTRQAFTPILEDVVRNKVPFPEICYNCAA